MSGVVLRCPNCGTTRSSPGECDACHEADVRYFCTNHTPGLWLDTAKCPDCGARFGEAPRPRPTPAREPATPVARRSPWGRRRDAGAAPHRPEPLAEPEILPPEPTSDVPSPERAAAIRRAVLAKLPEILRTTRRRAPDPTYTGESAYPPDMVPAGMAVGGCFARAIMLAFFLFFLLMLAGLMLGGSLLQGFGVVVF